MKSEKTKIDKNQDVYVSVLHENHLSALLPGNSQGQNINQLQFAASGAVNNFKKKKIKGSRKLAGLKKKTLFIKPLPWLRMSW